MKLHILLADDDAIDRELFVTGIEKTGVPCNISEVTNGVEAIDFLKTSSHLPDVIFMDLNMPVKDGRAAIKEIRLNNSYQGVPIFVLSTSNSRGDISHAYQSGADLFLVKPDDFTIMVNMLGTLLGGLNKYLFFRS